MSTIKVDTINTRTGSGNITFSRPTVLTAGDIITADIANDAVTSAKIVDDAVTIAKLAATGTASSSTFLRGDNAWAEAGGGKVVQVVNVTDSAVASGTASIEPDDSIPTKTEGDEYMTLAITPTNASNILLILISAQIGSLTTNVRVVTLALFQDTTTNAIAAIGHISPHAGQPDSQQLRHRMVAGTTSATTFKLRAGANGSGVTVRFNSNGSGRLYGGVSASSMTIMEIEV